MQYHGGKAKLAPKIAPLILAEGAGCHTYLEPFVGGANTFHRVAPSFDRAIGADLHEDIVLLWDAAAKGWVPPTQCSEEEYHAAKTGPPSAYRAFVGFGCSFGGKFFAGFARGAGDYAGAAHRGILRKAVPGAEFVHGPYTMHTPGAGWLVYCDPPYAGTTGYAGTGEFDSDAFYRTAERWAAAGAVVLVSEETAPAHWELIGEWEQRGTLSKDDNKRYRCERLFRPVKR